MNEEQVPRGVLPSRDRIASELHAAGDIENMIAAAQGIFAGTGRHFAVEAAEAVVECFDEILQRHEDRTRKILDSWLNQRWHAGPIALWVRARLLGQLGHAADAAKAWDVCIDGLPCIEPEALLRRARSRIATRDTEGAGRDLRLALRQPARYEFWQRADPLLRHLLQQSTPESRRELRIALLSGKASISLFVPMLRLACFRDEIDATLYTSEYNGLSQEILDPASGLYEFNPDVVVLMTHWRDAELPPFAARPDEVVEAVVSRYLSLWQTVRSRLACSIVAQGFDRPFKDPYGRLSTGVDNGRGLLLQRINAGLRREATGCITMLDLDAVAAQCGAEAWEDARQWHMAKQHPGTAGLIGQVEAHAAILRAITGLTKKVLALDLDNVLWGGVIGEDGLEKIRLGPPSPAGEAHQELQRYVKRLQERGVLLAVCSKNNEADARQPFESHPESILRPDDFVAFVANWDDKATNLRRIAETLSLGLESFVFLDDDPVERQWVRSQIPELVIPELPADPSRYVEVLAAGNYFEALAISADDRVRHTQYQRNIGRRELLTSAGSYGEFLKQLAMVAECGPFDSLTLQRIAQLVNKTNQFNLTTRRYSEAQLAEQARASDWWTRWFRLRDCYGDNGLIGILTCKPRRGESAAWEIDNWLLSCRALGRRMEDFMFLTVLEACRGANIQKLFASYLPTAKNGQVADLLPRFGFAPCGSVGEKTGYVLDVVHAEIPDVPIVLDQRAGMP